MHTEMSINYREVLGDYWELCKPRVVALMLLTAFVGMCLAGPVLNALPRVFFALSGIGLCAGSAAAINHLVDRRIDRIMARTSHRPVATERISVRDALIFSGFLGGLGFFMLCAFVNGLTAVLTFMSLIGYAVIYTGFLKRATPQNIVIGGLAGAAPPMLGWIAMTNHLDPEALLLVLIVFTWTPPHFWALAIHRYDDYQHAKIPMLPVTHGIAYTKLQILLYTILLLIVSVLPWLTGMCGMIYLVGALLLGLRFLHWSWRLYRDDGTCLAMQTFKFSIIYLMLLFLCLLSDHYIVW